MIEGELLVDTTSPLVAVQLGDGGVPASSHALPIPPLIELAGISVTCQALRLDTSGHQLTNALTLTLGL